MDFLYILGSIFVGIWVYMLYRNKRYLRKPDVIVVEGLIAAGKSTFVNILKQQLSPYYNKIVIVPEPVDIWIKTGSLVDFYADMKGKAYEFQTFVVVTRIKTVLEAYEKNKDADLFIIERSPYTDRYIFGEMLYRDGMISEHQMTKYEVWWDLWIKIWPFQISHIIHLFPGIEEAQKRCRARLRDGEIAVSTEYQTKLLDRHQEFFNSSNCPYPVFILDTPDDFRTNLRLQNEIGNKIKLFLDESN